MICVADLSPVKKRINYLKINRSAISIFRLATLLSVCQMTAIHPTVSCPLKMSPRLKISSYVLERLREVEGERHEGTGCVYGLMYDGTLLVVGLSQDTTDYQQLLLHTPTEVELCGAVRFGDALHTDAKLKEILRDVDITDNPLVLAVGEGAQLKAHFLVHERLEESPYEELSADELRRQFTHVRLRTVLPLVCEATVAGVKNALHAKRKKIASGQVSFHLEGSSVYMLGEAADVGVSPASGEPTLGQLVDSMSPEQHTKKKSNANTLEIVPVNILMRRSKDLLAEKLVKTAVKMVTTQGKPCYCVSTTLAVDGLAMVHRGVRLPQLYSVLVECACRSLRLLEHSLIQQLGEEGMGDGAGLRVPETFHFLPQGLGLFITRVVPRGLSEDSMETERRRLHEHLGLRTDRPEFRRGCAYPLQRSGALLAPHESLPPPPASDVLVALVRGRYTYHHYMQDQQDDDGWGCAYRSLQTLCSWFRLQGYTTEKIPTHGDIQRCLVAIGDKPASFVGSRQWIGSTEVSFCLETLLQVQSRIIFCPSGAELGDYAPDLLHHFRTHGSPIMIGGGVLAHTILGVEYNPETREARYLILDPHYTGPDDLASVLARGWCGWKPASFWNKTAHYNLCLPQVPTCL